MQARIVDRTGQTRTVPLTSGAQWIGSGADCPIRVRGSGVGVHHVRLELCAEGRYSIVDLGCPAGTRVNGERVVTAGPLGAWDVVHVGDCDIRIEPAPPAGAERGEAVPVAAQLDSSGHDAVTLGSACHESARLEAAGRLHKRLLTQFDLRRQDVASMSDAALRELATQLLQPLLPDEAARSGSTAAELLRFVLDEALGLGPLESLLADDEVREIMINGAGLIFVERAGRLQRADTCFSGEPALRGIIERIVTPIGRRVDDASPMVDARLPDGSRVNVVIPPLAVRGTAVTIRRFGRRRLTAADLLQGGALDAAMLEFLRICVEQRRNILVSGGTGSGKTTLLNVLSSLIPSGERVVTIEDSAELAFNHPNLVSLETRPRNIEGRGEITIRDLVRNSLRMRPDRIVIGECRGGETLDMLQAMNTGHDGSLSTVHANSPRELLSRLEVMVLMSGVELPVSAIREQIAGSVQIIVHQARYPCGARRITRITELTGVIAGTIQTQDIFRFVAEAPDIEGRSRGRFEATGHVPQFYEELRRGGRSLDLGLFGVATGAR
ncbi:MAG: FHA domain-containing protein [Sinobacteraceae bacterium]|nr:FHA domain-containing protein [Nevskiaceae bacterium]